MKKLLLLGLLMYVGKDFTCWFDSNQVGTCYFEQNRTRIDCVVTPSTKFSKQLESVLIIDEKENCILVASKENKK